MHNKPTTAIGWEDRDQNIHQDPDQLLLFRYQTNYPCNSDSSVTIRQALSRQNSLSMDDISQDEFYGTPKPTPMRARPVTGKTRERQRVMAKTVSVESLHYDSVQYSGSPTKSRYQHPEDIRKDNWFYFNYSSFVLHFVHVRSIIFNFQSRKRLYNHKCLLVCLSARNQNPWTAWNHHPSSFFIHPSS